MDKVNKIIEQARSTTIQSRVRETPRQGGVAFLTFLARAVDLIAPWWSPTRDRDLRKFWKKSDHLAGAMFAMVAKMTTIPFRIVARDMSIKSHVVIAEEYTKVLLEASQFGDGWTTYYSKCIEDYFGQDNGTFSEIIGAGPKDGPIVGPAIAVAHLDSALCTRTGNAEFPVIYQDDRGGKRYKLHYTRVMFASQMPSSNAKMFDVGVSAVSRCINAAQNLLDMSVYKQEKLGSRPARQLMITQGGLDPDDLRTAFLQAELDMSGKGLTRYAKTVAIGNYDLEKPDIKVVDLASAPDGFDEETSTILGMAVIALAFGVDARELFPVTATGASKADALIQHMKQRGKGTGQTLEVTERLFNQKYLPPFLKMVFDYQDDAQDRQRAEIRNIRAQARENDLGVMVTDIRTEREVMLENGELTEAQFEQLELNDGRLDDGVGVEVLFYSNDKDFKEWLSGANEQNYEQKKQDLMIFIVTSRDVHRIKKARQALAAIEFKLKELSGEEVVEYKPTIKKPDTSYSRDRFGRTLPRGQTDIPDEEEEYINR